MLSCLVFSRPSDLYMYVDPEDQDCKGSRLSAKGSRSVLLSVGFQPNLD